MRSPAALVGGMRARERPDPSAILPHPDLLVRNRRPGATNLLGGSPELSDETVGGAGWRPSRYWGCCPGSRRFRRRVLAEPIRRALGAGTAAPGVGNPAYEPRRRNARGNWVNPSGVWALSWGWPQFAVRLISVRRKHPGLESYMGHRWRDLWLEIEVRRRASFPYLRLRLRSVWDAPERAEEHDRPHLASSHQASGSQQRRAA